MEIDTPRPEREDPENNVGGDDDDECVVLGTTPDAARRRAAIPLARESIAIEDDAAEVAVAASVANLHCAISYLPLENPVTFSGCLERHPFRVFSAAWLLEYVSKALRLSKKRTAAGSTEMRCPVCDRPIAFRRVDGGALRPEDADAVRACLYLDLVRCRVDVLNAARDAHKVAFRRRRFVTHGKDLWAIPKSSRGSEESEGSVQVLAPQELADGLSASPHEDFLSVRVPEPAGASRAQTLAQWLAPAPLAAAILAEAARPVSVAPTVITLQQDVAYSAWIQRTSLDVERHFQDTLRRAPDPSLGEWVEAWKKFWGESHAAFATWAVPVGRDHARGSKSRGVPTSRRDTSRPLTLQKSEVGFHTRVINDLRREPPFHVSGLSQDLRDALLAFWRGRKEAYLSRVAPLMKKSA